MSTDLTRRPAPSEYAPSHAGYVDIVPEGDVEALLETQLRETTALLAGLDEAAGNHRYAPDKWSVKEVVGHVCDAERVFAYRMLRVARGDTTPLPGFEQNAWVPLSGAADRTLSSLVEEYRAVRAATLTLVGSLEPAAIGRAGMASGSPVTVRGLVYVIAGHERHHVTILRERYGLG